ncbi:hypothetical protein EI94DRAFT_466038 [Lactarius quietus]|nr:hypothetical protein EI94DRAFT_466038 [Lactarius quietus]
MLRALARMGTQAASNPGGSPLRTDRLVLYQCYEYYHWERQATGDVCHGHPTP